MLYGVALHCRGKKKVKIVSQQCPDVLAHQHARNNVAGLVLLVNTIEKSALSSNFKSNYVQKLL